ncbi:hypothetical protein LOTGIDRAFT_239161 [Lottia gigantea]|uniref:Hydroxylysine kinase n=1 Tax=Lottia gigantea TaxID=225164 RepID=V4AJF5_LOTGI|nr:hypothetical protein LOTGIDRAFT_239161 [Lottia gigantea]ESO97237.1 hypothetical protein LOTGIDRAFT_239161 [Lottia gigantea]
MEESQERNGQQSATQQVGEIIKPVVCNGTVEELLDTVYGLKAVSVTPLNSYDDCNYGIKVEPEWTNPHIKEVAPHGYLMKIINSMDSKRPEMHHAQHTLMDHLRSKGVPTQQPVPTKKGELISVRKIYADKNKTDYAEHIVRLMTFLPGQVLLNYPITTNLLYQSGMFIAKISNAMEGFHHEVFAHFETKWNLGHILILKDYVFVLKQDERDLVNKVIQAFEKEFVPLIPNLPKGYIHGDLNELNLLVMPVEDTKNLQERQYNFTGLIDFQDTTYSCTIYDLAINVAYLTIFTELIDQLDAPGHILAGYYSLKQLTEDEFNSLKILIAGRMCQSLVYGAHTHHLDPSDDYVLHTAKKGWNILNRLWSEPQEKLFGRWKMIMENYK